MTAGCSGTDMSSTQVTYSACAPQLGNSEKRQSIRGKAVEAGSREETLRWTNLKQVGLVWPQLKTLRNCLRT